MDGTRKVTLFNGLTNVAVDHETVDYYKTKGWVETANLPTGKPRTGRKTRKTPGSKT